MQHYKELATVIDNSSLDSEIKGIQFSCRFKTELTPFSDEENFIFFIIRLTDLYGNVTKVTTSISEADGRTRITSHRVEKAVDYFNMELQFKGSQIDYQLAFSEAVKECLSFLKNKLTILTYIPLSTTIVMPQRIFTDANTDPRFYKFNN